MKVLWVVNTIFPDLAKQISQPLPVFGGWMYSAAEMLSRCPSIQLSVATVYTGKPLFNERIGNINYHLISNKKNIKKQWQTILDRDLPDVIHVHGTEYEHGLRLMQLAKNIPSIVSIQGLVSVCARHYLGGLTFFDVIRNITLRDVLRMDTLFQQQLKMAKRSQAEQEYIARANVILGRTDWDRAHVEAMRHNSPYIHCDEMLRDEFYCNERWVYDKCKPHSIFVSQASYPLKGLHQLIKAAVIAKRHFPDIEIRVAGTDISKSTNWKLRIRRSGYEKYIQRLIYAAGMQESVKFLGPLDAAKMKTEYLRCNVSICPSAIENSSNSIAEAQVLGVPLIASQVGGVDTMTLFGRLAETYRFEEIELLAQIIIKVFSESEFSKACAARQWAIRRHEKDAIIDKLTSLYLSSTLKAHD